MVGMERQIAENMDVASVISGIETADEELFYEHMEANELWEDDPSNSEAQDRVKDLSEALVALRVVKAVINEADLSDDQVQELAQSVRMEDASTESLIETAEAVEEAFSSD